MQEVVGMYYAIIGDLIASRKLKDRKEVQERLIDVINEMNIKYQVDIVKPMKIMQGDDFQVLLSNPAHIFDMIHDIIAVMTDVDIRFGIGMGNLSFNYDDGSSDGPVWWHARDALDIIKSNERKHMSIYIKGMNDKEELLINQLLINNQVIIDQWTLSQKSFVHALIKNYGLNDRFVQKDLAKQLNYSPSTVSEKLKSTYYYVYLENIEIIKKYL